MTLPNHTQVILGPPGTGKTSTLLGLIEDELEKQTDPTRIGFFTFTKKAVNEGFCTVHEKTKQRKDGKLIQCKKIKSDGKRCGMQTSNQSGYCYYHD